MYIAMKDEMKFMTFKQVLNLFELSRGIKVIGLDVDGSLKQIKANRATLRYIRQHL